jgi:Domain of unknown function (DUF5666)
MDNLHSERADPVLVRASRAGRARRVAATAGVSIALLAAGAGIGIALTGGASASPGSAGPVAASPGSQAASRCAHIAAQLRSSGHPAAALRLKALCSSPLLRLALVGGEYGQATFQDGTIAFERGTVESVTGSQFAVRAPNGTSWTWHVTASTAFREAGQATNEAALARGAQVLVGGPVVRGAHDARLVRLCTASVTGTPSASG